VKLLFDENLAPRLAAALSDLYPSSIHVRDCGLLGATDGLVWQYAQENGFVIVSKDSDYFQRSALRGGPPKVIWLRIGNGNSARAEFVLRNTVERVLAFERREESCLVLMHPRSG
jgi:predicted nuclease of predicted toxin-antitoxin system